MEQELTPLPFTKHQRVWFEVLRTFASLTTVCINAAIFLKVFKVI
jgi:hypothetical protein